MLPTPSTSHVDTNLIYEPAEDSFLFLDTLSSAAETSFLKERFAAGGTTPPASNNDDEQTPSPLAVEIGIGSGVVLGFLTAHAQTILGRSDILSLGVDINPYACRASIQTIEQARQDVAETSLGVSRSSDIGVVLTSLTADLTSALRPGTVDILLFNPPYVPTAEMPQRQDVCVQGDDDGLSGPQQTNPTRDSNLLAFSYAGGVDGMEVTNRLLEQIPLILDAKRGVAYVLLCKQNKPEEVAQRIQAWGADWAAKVVGRSGKQGGWEKLQILRICRRNHIRSGC